MTNPSKRVPVLSACTKNPPESLRSYLLASLNWTPQELPTRLMFETSGQHKVNRHSRHTITADKRQYKEEKLHNAGIAQTRNDRSTWHWQALIAPTRQTSGYMQATINTQL